MPGPISNNAPIRQATTPQPSQPAAPAPQPATTPAPAGFTPPAASAGSVQNVANPATGFTGGPSAPVASATTPAKPAGPMSLADFKAMVPKAGVDVYHYEQVGTAYKGMSKDDRKAALKYVHENNQYGLEKYLKDSSGGGGFLSSLGNALGEALFGGNR